MAVGVGLALASSALPRSAAACGVRSPPQYAISDVWPSDGATGVAPNAGFVIQGLASSDPGGPGLPLHVELIDDETGEAQPLREIPWYSEQPSGAWYPVEPLRPDHIYRLEVRLDDSLSPPDPASATFSTGQTLLEPLEIEGDIEVTYEAYDESVHRCDGTSCGPMNCVRSGTRRALRAKLALPAASGGQAVNGRYNARIYLTDNTPPQPTEPNVDGTPPVAAPHEIHLAGVLQPIAGNVLSYELELPQEDFAYAPCFTWVVWDPAGHKQEVSKCLAVLTPDDYLALTGAAPTDAAEATTDVAPGAASASPGSSGCAVRPGASGTGAALLGLLAAVLAGVRRRSSRAPSATGRRSSL